MSRIFNTTSGYTLVQWATYPNHFTCVELDGVDLPLSERKVVVLREGKFYDFVDNAPCEELKELVEQGIKTCRILDLSLGDAFTLGGAVFEVTEDWEGECPDTIECVNADELRYVEMNPFLRVQVKGVDL